MMLRGSQNAGYSKPNRSFFVDCGVGYRAGIVAGSCRLVMRN
jgi:hypothetical protein